MLFDSHCHAWQRWPYQPPVPDPEQRSSIGQLLYEMDQHGIERALVVCAEISTEIANNGYVAAAVREHPDRLHQLAELDSHWKPAYHQPGAAARYQALLDQWALVGVTHYLSDDDDGAWLHSVAGCELFELLAAHAQIASIHCKPHHIPAIRKIATLFPQVPVLIHHLGHIAADQPDQLNTLLEAATHDNICLKVSGFYYGTRQPLWDFPLRDMQPIVQALHRRYGAARMFWGSDFPVCLKKGITYVQALEKVRHHCAFITPADLDLIMGDALYRLLDSLGHIA